MGREAMTSAFDVIVQDDAMPDEPDMGFFLAWLDALRSGGYPQSSSMLRTSEGYCCLGVACNVHPHTYPTTSGYTFEGSTDYQRMPKELRDRIGLPPDFEQELIDKIGRAHV